MFTHKKFIFIVGAIISIFIIGMGVGEGATKHESKLAGFAMIPYDSYYETPKDSPFQQGSGFFAAPDRKRRHQYASIVGTSFLSDRKAPRIVSFDLPIPKQPLQGFSGIISMGDGTFWVLSDNGFGDRLNSPDFHLTAFHIKPYWKSGKVAILKQIFLHDSDFIIPFRLVNEYTEKRYLTGVDLDIESIQKVGDYFYFGDEFGPYLIKTDSKGKVVGFWETPGDGGVILKSPDHFQKVLPSVPGKVEFAVRRSRGFEGMAQSVDGRYLYPMLEGPIWDAKKGDWEKREGKAHIRILEFDIKKDKYTGRQWKYLLEDDKNNIGDFNMIDAHTGLIIERDGGEGDPRLACKDVVTPECFNVPAKFKRVYKIDFSKADAEGFVKKVGYIDLMDIKDPDDRNKDGERIFTFPFVTIESVAMVDKKHIIVANDNNIAFSSGRKLGVNDDNEFILLHVPEFLHAR
ncbi:MAG TPA: glycerophosphodiester phosphodiesterase [Nitrospiraceae bacterium]|nr:glycerophosphodiester phosphodiesterase [Nitrospiraceae bacterium]